ncbi:hypothetical protein NC652_012196 [Populus alba x Populus x berolinensis]|nr:hypothetical protein NC652_012196 [Populus alba x Populus x berolinensis]
MQEISSLLKHFQIMTRDFDFQLKLQSLSFLLVHRFDRGREDKCLDWVDCRTAKCHEGRKY